MSENLVDPNTLGSILAESFSSSLPHFLLSVDGGEIWRSFFSGNSFNKPSFGSSSKGIIFSLQF